MISIPMKTSGSLNSDNILSINHTRIQGALTRQELTSVNRGAPCQTPDMHSAPGTWQAHDSRHTTGTQQSSGHRTAAGAQQSAAPDTRHTCQPAMTRTSVPHTSPVNTIQHRTPVLHNLIQKGQKLGIGTAGQLQGMQIAMGWNTTDPRCDIDLSAYLLDRTGKVPGDDWFVFYGQTISPDGSVSLDVNGSAQDREVVDIDFTKLKPLIHRIVFVLTINEALTCHLNFSMIRDAYIRLLDPISGREILSFLLTDYYANVTSMMLGEIYLYNDTWKFSAIGNGVAKDLAGLCELYGVRTN